MPHPGQPCRILVVCEGNHCRSPMAEVLLRQGLPEGVEVLSAGLHALVGQPADTEAQRLLAEEGLPLAEHLGRSFDPQVALGTDLILVMERAQVEECCLRMPVLRGRVFLLGHWLGEERVEIPDPYGRGPEAMQTCLIHIRQAVEAWLPRLGAAWVRSMRRNPLPGTA